MDVYSWGGQPTNTSKIEPPQYQLKQAIYYVNEHVSVQGSYEMSGNQNENILNIIHVEMQSRHES